MSCEDCEDTVINCDDPITVVVDCDEITITTSCEQGIQGPPGVSGWSSTISYNAGDVVFYNGLFYEALSDSLNVQPDTHPLIWDAVSSGGGGGAVDSVFGRTGTVVAQSNDYNDTQIYVNDADISAASSGDVTGSNVHTILVNLITNFSSIITAILTNMFNKSSDTTDVITEGTTNKFLSSTDKTDLTDGGDSSLHYHSSDRNRSNHTGTQLASTISNFDTQVRTSRLDQMAQPTADVSINSNKITNVSTPTSDNDAANKSYVDARDWKQSVRLATAAALPTNTYNNGSSGVGATITINSTGTLTVDSVTTALNDRILVKDESSASKNGVYIVTTAGATGVQAVLTRVSDLDQPSEFVGSVFYVRSGSANLQKIYGFQGSTAPTIGSSSIVFATPTPYTAGTGIAIVSNAITVDPLTVIRSATPTSVKTANYTINAYEYVPVDATSGDITITASSLTNGNIFAIEKVAGSNNVIFTTSSGTPKFFSSSGSSSYTISLLNQAVYFYYYNSVLYPVGSHLELAQLDSRYTTIANAKVADAITDGVTTIAPSQNAVYDALALKESTANKGSANGYASLDGSGLVPSAQLPSYVDDVIEAANFAALPVTGETSKIYVTLDDNKTYRWSGSAYVEISASLALGETSATAYRGDRGKTAYDHSQLLSGNPHNVTKSEVGLGSVTNDAQLKIASNLSDVASASSAFSNIKQQATDTATGVVELATLTEVNTGTDTDRVVSPDTLSGSYAGTKVIELYIVEATTSLTTGDGKVYYRIPTALNGMDLISAGAAVITTSSSGNPTIQFARGRQSSPTSAHTFVDMLSTSLTIDATEYDSKDATTPAVINTSNDDVLTGDLIRVDVDGAGTGTKGLIITMSFRLP